MIKINMQMPENCFFCRFRLATGIGQRCVVELGRVIDVDVTARPEWCPLEEQEEEIEHLKRPDCEHAEHDGTGCLGYCGCAQDDEPIEYCKRCEKYTGNIGHEVK